MKRVRGWTAVALLLVTALGTAACTSHPQQRPDPPVDLKTLDVGSYPTRPKPIPLPATMDEARRYEAQRISNRLPLPMDIDPAFRFARDGFPMTDNGEGTGATPIQDFRPEVNAPDYLTGFFSAAGSDPDWYYATRLSYAVLVLPDHGAAERTATTLYQQQFAKGKQSQVVPLPEYPGAHSFWEPDRLGIWSWYTTDRYVIFSNIIDNAAITLRQENLPALTALTQKCIDAIGDSLRGITPTAADKLQSVDPDPDHIRAITLQRGSNPSRFFHPPGVYDAHGALHFWGQNFMPDLDRTKQMYADAGIDRVAVDDGILFRARDAAGAQLVRDNQATLGKEFRRVEGPKNLPAASCRVSRKTRAQTGSEPVQYYCDVTYGRYAATVTSNQLLDAQQRIAAQYAILVNTR